MELRLHHPWPRTAREAVALQERLRPRVRIEPGPRRASLVAGADVAYAPGDRRVVAAVVVVRLPVLDVVEKAVAVGPVPFPYIPGLFAFRELPLLVAAFRQLATEPDVLLLDGQGIAHPRRFGLASHAGLLFDRPAVGCAKSRLVGTHAAVGHRRGAAVRIVAAGTTVGAAVRTRTGVAPVLVSPGHRIDIAGAVALVLATAPRFRVPEPIRCAHNLAASTRER